MTVTCPTCNYVYWNDDENSSAGHVEYHDEWVYGVRLERDPREVLVRKFDDFELLESSLRQEKDYRYRFADIGLRAIRQQRDCVGQYDGSDYDARWDGRAYALRRGDRAIAFAVMRNREGTAHATWQVFAEGDNDSVVPSEYSRWTFDFLWVLEAERRKGYCRLLCEAIAEHLNVQLHESAWWLDFTPAGKGFARHISPDGVWLAR